MMFAPPRSAARMKANTNLGRGATSSQYTQENSEEDRGDFINLRAVVRRFSSHPLSQLEKPKVYRSLSGLSDERYKSRE